MQLDFYTERYPPEVEPAIVDLFISTFSAPPRNETWDLESASAYICEHYGPSTILATISSDAGIIGFCYGMSLRDSSKAKEIYEHARIMDGFYLADIAISHECRGSGYGRSLLEAFLAEVAKSHQHCIARTREDAHAIRHLFTSVGFVERGRYQATIAGSTASRLIYLKRK